MSQIPFHWPARTSYALQDFIPGTCNQEALQFLECWPGKATGKAIITGPAFCGKTHLVRWWAERTHAGTIDVTQLGKQSSDSLWGEHRACVLEDIHMISEEEAFFHLLRHAESYGLSLLMTSRVPARQLSLSLPDLRSRLVTLPDIEMHAPDEAVLRLYFIKCFSDHQWHVGSEIIAYLLPRMERSFASIRALVDRIEQKLAQTNREISISLVRTCLQKD